MAAHDAETVRSPKSRPAATTAGETGRVALISDVHGNLPALRAVLEAVEEAGVEAVWCLGDVVGYGAQPNECVALRARALRALPGG